MSTTTRAVPRMLKLLEQLGFGKAVSGSRSSSSRSSSGSAKAAAASAMATQEQDEKRRAAHYDVVVVGGGNAAGYVAKTLADMDYSGKVAIVSREPVAPYERPALSKAFLHPPDAKVRARLPGFHTSVGGGGERQTPEWYGEKGMDLMLSTSATNVDVSKNTVTVEQEEGSASVLTFDKLVLATGAKALSPSDIRMDNAGLDNVFTIREEAEALQMVNTLEAGKESIKTLAIVGGGYLGMECAAAFCGWGFNVVMVFPEKYLMSRLFSDEVAAVFEKYFEAKGITIRKECRVTGLTPGADDASKVGGIKLESGEVIEADACIFGVGARVNASLADGLDKGEGRVGGYKVNGSMRTSNPDVFAVGDIAALNGKARFEHVDFCRKSAAKAAEAIVAGKDVEDLDYLPYFYSRLFEYTETPLVFQFYGDSDTSDGQTIEVFGDYDKALETKGSEAVPQFGAAWVDPASKEVRGVMLCNAPSDRYDAAREAVVAKATFSTDFLQ